MGYYDPDAHLNPPGFPVQSSYAGGSANTRGGGAPLVVAGPVGIILFALLLVAAVYTAVVGTAALFGSIGLLAYLRWVPGDARKPRRFAEVYVATFQGLLLYALAGTTVLLMTREVVRGVHAVPDSELWNTYPTAMIGAVVFWQVLGLLACAGVLQHRLRENFSGRAGQVRSYFAAFLAIAPAAAVGGLMIFTTGLSDLGFDDLKRNAALALFLFVIAAVDAAIAAVVVKVFDVVDRRGRHGFFDAFAAILLGLAGFSAIVGSGLLCVPAMRDAALAVPPLLRGEKLWSNAELVPTVAFAALVGMALVVLVVVLVFKLGPAHRGVYGFLKSCFVGTGAAAFCLPLVLFAVQEVTEPDVSPQAHGPFTRAAKPPLGPPAAPPTQVSIRKRRPAH